MNTMASPLTPPVAQVLTCANHDCAVGTQVDTTCYCPDCEKCIHKECSTKFGVNNNNLYLCPECEKQRINKDDDTGAMPTLLMTAAHAWASKELQKRVEKIETKITIESCNRRLIIDNVSRRRCGKQPVVFL
jgi:hypothetical protein